MVAGVRARAADVLRRVADWLAPVPAVEGELRPVEEDPELLVVAAVKVAAAAGERGAATRAVHDAVTSRLDDRTVHLMLLLLAADVGTSSVLAPSGGREWAQTREFDLLVAAMDGKRRG